MPDFTQILRTVSATKFGEVLGASSRKAREAYFHRHGVRSPKTAGRMPRPGAKNEARIAALYEALQAREDDEMVEEMLRTWLLSKRPLLAAALDHLGIPHDNGLTESDEVSRFEKLSRGDLKGLVEALTHVAPAEDIGIYLKFMGVSEVDEALGVSRKNEATS